MKESSVEKKKDVDPQSLQHLLTVCNTHGIKACSIWSYFNPYHMTYFLMPDFSPRIALIQDDMLEGSIKIDGDDFVRFWNELGYYHKERRFLANFMAFVRHINESLEPNIPREQSQKAIFIDLVTDITWMLRRLLFVEQKNPGFSTMVKRFFVEAPFCREAIGSIFSEFFFEEIFRLAYMRTEMINHVPTRGAILEILIPKPETFISFLLIGIIRSYTGWVALDTPILQRYLQNRTRFFDLLPPNCFQSLQHAYTEKMKVAAPHWRAEDRAFILQAIERKGSNYSKTYVDLLIEAVGVDQFKVSDVFYA